MVVRAFENADIPHATAELDPIADVETVRLELVLADLATVERHLEKAKVEAKGKPPDLRVGVPALESLEARLNEGKMARGNELTDAEIEQADLLNLLTAKPFLYVANVGEQDLPNGSALIDPLRRLADDEQAHLVIICAQCEADLAEWPAEDAVAYLRELGVEEPGLRRFIRAGYRLLDLTTFYTITGGKEVRAWPILNGTTVSEAAGQIHTDMQRGFVRAEVIGYDALVNAGSALAAREKGLMHVEGKDYIVQDGDVIHIRFGV
jgi:GTP-binding protein YchF